LATIRATFEPGRVNDYSFDGESHVSLVGLDHALFRLGLRDRSMIRSLQFVLIATICGVTYTRLWSGRIDRAEACATLGLIAGIFFYHRIYDEVMMALPLVYGALRASSSEDRSERRRWAAFGSLALLVVYVSPDGLRMLEAASFELGTAGVAIRSTLLPLAVWLILAAFLTESARAWNGNPRLIAHRCMGFFKFSGWTQQVQPSSANCIAVCRDENR
jgi:hypothetical protein